MGNEMGNNNVTGLQEQDDTKLKAPNRSSEASIASVNVDDDEPVKHTVSSPKEKDFHVKDVSLNSKNPSGIGDPHIEKEASDKKDDSETQPPNGSSEVPSVTNDTNDGETRSISSSKDDETDDSKIQAPNGSSEVPSGRNETKVEEKQSIPFSKDDETDDSEIQAPGGSSEVPLTKNDTNVEETRSIPTYKDNETRDYEIQAPNGSLSVPLGTNDTNVDETEFIPTSKDGETDDYRIQVPNCSSSVPLETNDTNVEETEFIPTLEDGERDSYETQVPNGCSSVPFRANDTNVEETQFIPTSLGNSPKRTDKEIQKQPSIERELNNIEVQIPFESSKPPLLSNDTSAELQSVQSAGILNEIKSSGKDPSETETSFNQIQKQSFRTDTGNTDVEAPKGFLKAQLVPSDVNDEQPNLVSSSEDKSFDEEASASEKNPSGTCDQQLQNQSMIGGEGTKEQMMNSSLDTKSAGHDPEPMESVEMKSDSQELVKIHPEPLVEVGSRLQGSNEEGKNEPHDSDEEGKKLEHEIDEKLEGSIIPTGDLVEHEEREIQNMEKESQEKELPDLSSINERKLENEGRVEVGLTDINALKNDEMEELNLFCKNYTDPHLEVVQSAKPPESLQVEVSECKEKLQVQEEDANLIKNGSETEQNKQNPNPFSVSEGSEEESKVDKMDTVVTDLMMIGTTNNDEKIEETEQNKQTPNPFSDSEGSEEESKVDKMDTAATDLMMIGTTNNDENIEETEQNKQNPNPFSVSEGSEEESKVDKMDTVATDLMMIGTTNNDEKIEETEVCGFCDSGIEFDFKVDAANATENGCQVNNLHDSNMNLACQGNGLEFEKITESIVEISSSPQCFSPSCDFKEIIAVKQGDSNKEVLKGGEQSGILKQIFIQSDPTEHAEVSVSNCPVPVEKSQDVLWDLSLLAPDMEDNRRSSNLEPNQENSYHNEVTKDTSNLTNSTGDHDDSRRDFPTAESKEKSNNGLKQEVLSNKIESRDEANFDLGILIAKTDVSMRQTDRQDSEHNSTPTKQETDAKDGNFSTVSCDFEAKQSANRFTTESNSENLESHAEVTETSNKTRIEDSDKSPLLFKEETVDRDVFELKRCDNETFANKFEVHAGNTVANTKYTTLNSSKEECGQETSQDQEFSAEKQAIEMERSDSEKLKIPLLSFMKEKSTIVMGFQQKQENFGKKAVEDKRNSAATEIKDTSPQSGREKRKIKSSFFSNCMCCTAVIQ